MIKLNLETKNEAEKRIKDYLEENVSETLANKINNGVSITKENKILINKKTLSGFMNFANNEARKQAENGLNYACIEDNIVYGWAIHYFEEETIEEKLFNEDGSDYKVEIKTTPKPVKIEQPKKKENTQASLFELMNSSTTTQENKIEKKDTRFKLTEEEKRILRDVFDEEVEDDEEDINEEPIEYDEVEDSDNNIDDFTEEEIEKELDIIAEEVKQQINDKTSATQTKLTMFDKEITKKLYALFEGNLEVK